MIGEIVLRRMKSILPIWLALLLPICGAGQGGLAAGKSAGFPSAPMPQKAIPPVSSSAPMSAPQSPAQPGGPGTPTLLSLKDAQALALKNNPQISVARLTALASQQVTQRSAVESMANCNDQSHRRGREP